MNEDRAIRKAIKALADGDANPVLALAETGVLPTDAPIVAEAWERRAFERANGIPVYTVERNTSRYGEPRPGWRVWSSYHGEPIATGLTLAQANAEASTLRAQDRAAGGNQWRAADEGAVTFDRL